MLDAITGGCGPGGLGDYLVPDTLWGLNVKPACKIHDFYYSEMMPGTIECKEEADRVFLNNMIRIIKAVTDSKILRVLRMRRAKTYYVMVKDFGGHAFWANKNDDKNLRHVEVK